jgi:putative chitinase
MNLLATLKAVAPRNLELDSWVPLLQQSLPLHSINNHRRVAHFLSQCAQESGDFTRLEENLNYSAARLLQVFPSYFGLGKRNPQEYAYAPQKLANYVYSDEHRRNKLGNTQPGDGWMFRGRGLIQITGRSNYTRFARSMNMPLEQAVEYAATPKGALDSALWFWSSNSLNAVADTGTVEAVTRRVNGGTHGLAERTQKYQAALTALASNTRSTLRRGDKGPGVVEMQKALGVTADGIFGPKTEAALKAWQKSKNLTPDGIAGPLTFAAMFPG